MTPRIEQKSAQDIEVAESASPNEKSKVYEAASSRCKS